MLEIQSSLKAGHRYIPDLYDQERYKKFSQIISLQDDIITICIYMQYEGRQQAALWIIIPTWSVPYYITWSGKILTGNQHPTRLVFIVYANLKIYQTTAKKIEKMQLFVKFQIYNLILETNAFHPNIILNINFLHNKIEKTM